MEFILVGFWKDFCGLLSFEWLLLFYGFNFINFWFIAECFNNILIFKVDWISVIYTVLKLIIENKHWTGSFSKGDE